MIPLEIGEGFRVGIPNIYHIIYAGFFSAAVNILLLVPILYMLQVYDRVLSSGSYSTLGMLTLLMVLLLLAKDHHLPLPITAAAAAAPAGSSRGRLRSPRRS